MSIYIELLEKCLELSRYEKDLIERININHETQVSVAKHYKKSPPTINIQYKRAMEKFLEWKKKHESPAEANLDRYVFGRLNRGDSPWKIIADVGHTDEVMRLSEKWHELRADDYWTTRNFLNSYRLMSGFEQEEKPLAKAVESVVDWLDEEQQENQDLRERLEEVTNKLSSASNKLDTTNAEVAKLEKLRKYEKSEEKRQALQIEIDSLKGEIGDLKGEINDLKGNVEELKKIKARLEREVNKAKQVKADVERDTVDAILQYMEQVQFADVLKLYNTALRRRIKKRIDATWT